MAARPPANTVVRMFFAAIVFTTLAVVILALIALGLWGRRRASDIWEEDVVRSAAVRSSVEQRDVEEILARNSGDAEPPSSRNGAVGSGAPPGRPDRLRDRQ